MLQQLPLVGLFYYWEWVLWTICILWNASSSCSLSQSVYRFFKRQLIISWKIRFWTGIVFENSGKLWTEHLLLTYEKFSKLTQNPLESSAKILKAFTRCSRKVETDNDQRIKDVSTEIYHAYVALCYFTPLFGAIIVRDLHYNLQDRTNSKYDTVHMIRKEGVWYFVDPDQSRFILGKV